MSLRNPSVSSASQVSPLQLRATQRFSSSLALKELQISIVSASVLCSGRETASVPPLSCCHPARASRATPQQKTIVFAEGASISFRRRAQSDLACAASSRSASFPCPLSHFPFFLNFGLWFFARYRLDLIVPESS